MTMPNSARPPATASSSAKIAPASRPPPPLAALEQPRVDRDERRAQRALAEQVLQHVRHAQRAAERRGVLRRAEVVGEDDVAGEAGDAAEQDAGGDELRRRHRGRRAGRPAASLRRQRRVSRARSPGGSASGARFSSSSRCRNALSSSSRCTSRPSRSTSPSSVASGARTACRRAALEPGRQRAADLRVEDHRDQRDHQCHEKDDQEEIIIGQAIRRRARSKNATSLSRSQRGRPLRRRAAASMSMRASMAVHEAAGRARQNGSGFSTRSCGAPSGCRLAAALRSCSDEDSLRA
jgi:hypothetical protein